MKVHNKKRRKSAASCGQRLFPVLVAMFCVTGLSLVFRSRSLIGTSKFVTEDASLRSVTSAIVASPTDEKLSVSTATSPYAYAFVLGECDPDRPRYRNYLYGVLVAAYMLRAQGSSYDMILFLEMYHETPHATLPDNELAALKALNVTIRMVPPDPNPSYYRIQLNKFRVLGLTEYHRVLYLDSDILPMANLDYLLEASHNGTVNDNVGVIGKHSPVNGGFFILTPEEGDLARVNSMIQKQEQVEEFDPVVGWGQELTRPWVALGKIGSSWTFIAASGDQGLLYYWLLFVKKSASIATREGRMVNWKAGDDGILALEGDKNPFPSAEPVHCWRDINLLHQCRTRPFADFVHFNGVKKPWYQRYPKNLSPKTKFNSPVHFWFWTLETVSKEFNLGIDVRSITDEKDNAHPGVSSSTRSIGGPLTNLLDG